MLTGHDTSLGFTHKQAVEVFDMIDTSGDGNLDLGGASDRSLHGYLCPLCLCVRSASVSPLYSLTPPQTSLHRTTEMQRGLQKEEVVRFIKKSRQPVLMNLINDKDAAGKVFVRSSSYFQLISRYFYLDCIIPDSDDLHVPFDVSACPKAKIAGEARKVLRESAANVQAPSHSSPLETRPPSRSKASFKDSMSNLAAHGIIDFGAEQEEISKEEWAAFLERQRRHRIRYIRRKFLLSGHIYGAAPEAMTPGASYIEPPSGSILDMPRGYWDDFYSYLRSNHELGAMWYVRPASSCRLSG